MSYENMPQFSSENGLYDATTTAQLANSFYNTAPAQQMYDGHPNFYPIDGSGNAMATVGQNGNPNLIVYPATSGSPAMINGDPSRGITSEQQVGNDEPEYITQQDDQFIQQITEQCFRCFGCEQQKDFKRKSDAVRHANEQHSNAEPHRCPTCGKTYKRPYVLRAHIEKGKCAPGATGATGN